MTNIFQKHAAFGGTAIRSLISHTAYSHCNVHAIELFIPKTEPEIRFLYECKKIEKTKCFF